MKKEEMLQQERSLLLTDAYRIFFDATDYEPNILIGYCRLIKDVLKDDIKHSDYDIVLHRLIKVCKNFNDNSKFILMARYGLTGQAPLSFKEISNVLFLSTSSVSNLCTKALEKLRSDTLSQQYSMSAKKRCMSNYSSFLANNHICILNLSAKTYNALLRANIITLQQFNKLNDKSLKHIKGIGELSIIEILEKQKELQHYFALN